MEILAISAHPDDETLGCGGALLKHQAGGGKLYWLIATRPQSPEWPEQVADRKSLEIQKVAEAYQVKKFFRLDFPAAHLDQVPIAQLIEAIREVVTEVKPAIVYLVHGGDAHTDHGSVFVAATSVLKPFYLYRMGVRRVLCYEVLSSTEAAPPSPQRAFLPNIFTDITSFIDRKLEIMSLYESETQPDPLPRGPSAIRALARYRGSAIGMHYAEAFMLIRELA